MNRKGLISLFVFGGVLLTCAVVFAFNARRIALYAAGFRGGEDTEIVLRDTAAGSISGEEGELQSGARLDTVTFYVNGRSGTIDTSALNLTRAEQTQTASGQPAYYFEYNEQDLNQIVSSVVVSAAPAELSNQIRNVQVDLKQNAAVVSAEANLGFFWQPLAIVVAIDSATRTVDVTGIDINGQFFTTPPAGVLADWIQKAESQGTQALQTTTLAGPNGETLSISQVVMTEDGLQVVAR